MKSDFNSKVKETINASKAEVWEGLTNPEMVKKYMMGANIETDWKKGSSIKWKGADNGKKFEDKGKILEVKKGETLSYSHFSPMTGEEDVPENYHTVTIHLSGDAGKTTVTLEQDKNKSQKEKDESEKNWKMMLEGLKKVVE